MESSDSGSESNRERTDNESTETDPRAEQSDSGGGWSIRRRDALVSILGIGGLGVLGSQHGSAQQGPPPRSWNQDVDAQGNRLLNLGALTMQANQTEITDFEGSNLSIDGTGVLNVTSSVRPDIHDDGTTVRSDTEVLNFGAGLSATDAGDGTATIDIPTGSIMSEMVADGTIQTADIGRNGASSGEVLKWDGSAWTPAPDTDTDTDTHTLVSDLDGSPNDVEAEDIEFGSNLSVTDNGGGDLSVDATTTSPWEDADTDALLETPNFDGIEVENIESPDSNDLTVESAADLVLSISGGDGAVRIETEGGHEIVLDDEDGAESLSVEDSAGNSFEMDATTGEVSVSATEKITLDAPTIDLSADVDLNIESEGSLHFESDGSTNLMSSGVMDIKGATINLNGPGNPAAREGDSIDDTTDIIDEGSTTVSIG